MYKYTLVGDVEKKDYFFETWEDVFHPTDTSNLLIEACKSSITSPKKILDLGCGCGLVGIVLAKLGLCRGPAYASDISKRAIALANINAERMSVDYVSRSGSLLEPWEGEKFDVIVDDVSGISDDIAAISSWYPSGVDCSAGKDGTKWIIKVIEQSGKYLKEGGELIFPVLSLSNQKKIIETLKKTYFSFELIVKKDWFVPDQIVNKTDVFMPMIEEEIIDCQKKYGKWIWSTYIYKAVKKD